MRGQECPLSLGALSVYSVYSVVCPMHPEPLRTAGAAVPCIFVLPDGLVSTGTVPFLSGSGRLPGRYKLDREAGANQVRAVPRYHFLR